MRTSTFLYFYCSVLLSGSQPFIYFNKVWYPIWFLLSFIFSLLTYTITLQCHFEKSHPLWWLPLGASRLAFMSTTTCWIRCFQISHKCAKNYVTFIYSWQDVGKTKGLICCHKSCHIRAMNTSKGRVGSINDEKQNDSWRTKRNEWQCITRQNKSGTCRREEGKEKGLAAAAANNVRDESPSKGQTTVQLISGTRRVGVGDRMKWLITIGREKERERGGELWRRGAEDNTAAWFKRRCGVKIYG